jgi:hypothetical protein
MNGAIPLAFFMRLFLKRKSPCGAESPVRKSSRLWCKRVHLHLVCAGSSALDEWSLAGFPCHACIRREA